MEQIVRKLREYADEVEHECDGSEYRDWREVAEDFRSYAVLTTQEERKEARRWHPSVQTA
jgi:hypothetical protein